MKLLIDTNIFIPMEPTSLRDLSDNSPAAANLARLASLTGTQLWLHPAQRIDIAQDETRERRTLREQLFEKYNVLNIALENPPLQGTNDWVDRKLIDALSRNAVTALVTEDRRLTHKAIRELGPERVITLADAVSMLSSLVDSEIEPPPAVEALKAYQLDTGDPIWATFRAEYEGFDHWLQKCQLEHRQAWVIRSLETGLLSGVVIVNNETQELRGSKTLKICSFKVDNRSSGRRFGELLLKSIFFYAYQHQYDSIFITAFPQHDQLIGLLTDFGFKRDSTKRETDELSFTKRLERSFPTSKTTEALAYFTEMGPFVIDCIGPPSFIVPILPKFHAMLFPELQSQYSLIPGREAYGNSLRKAYLSGSKITLIEKGSVLYFYRSEDEQQVRSWGVVENTLRSSDVDEICSFVLPRTVYTREQISELCLRGPVLAIIFRQCLRRIENPVGIDEMIQERILQAAPQTITSLNHETKLWMAERCKKQS